MPLTGSVRVTSLMAIERYSHVMHMVSHVIGRLRTDVSTYDALRAYFPHGTVTGAPKIRTMEIIAELEGEQRGGYGGCVGYVDYSGNMDTCIALRTIVIQQPAAAGQQPSKSIAYVQAGAGIVADSDPALEYQETLNKARGLLKAIEITQQRAQF